MEKSKQDIILSILSRITVITDCLDEINTEGYTKIPFGELFSLGSVFSSFAGILRETITDDTLYKMVVPKDLTKPKFTDVGNIYEKGKRGISARAKYIAVDNVSKDVVKALSPSLLFVGLSLVIMNKKLSKIEQLQKEMLDYLKLKDKANLVGNVLSLREIIEEYKYNCQNEIYKINKHIQVQQIKREAEQSIVFYREQIEKKYKKKGLINSEGDIKKKLENIIDCFKDYELALYIYALTSFLEAMLLENFASDYLNSIANRIEQQVKDYQTLHTSCYEFLVEASRSSVQAFVLKGVAGINKALGKGMSKIPKIRDAKVDESLVETGERVENYSNERIEKMLQDFSVCECVCVVPLVETIKVMSTIFNENADILVDKENIYLCSGVNQ